MAPFDPCRSLFVGRRSGLNCRCTESASQHRSLALQRLECRGGLCGGDGQLGGDLHIGRWSTDFHETSYNGHTSIDRRKLGRNPLGDIDRGFGRGALVQGQDDRESFGGDAAGVPPCGGHGRGPSGFDKFREPLVPGRLGTRIE